MTVESKMVPSERASSPITYVRPTSSFSGFTVTEHRKHSDVFQRILEDYGDEGWDGFQAAAITRTTVYLARSINSHLMSYSRRLRPHIAPGANGTIAFEFSSHHGTIRDIYIEARPDRRIRAYWVKSDGKKGKLPATEPVRAINELAKVLRVFSEEGRSID